MVVPVSRAAPLPAVMSSSILVAANAVPSPFATFLAPASLFPLIPMIVVLLRKKPTVMFSEGCAVVATCPAVAVGAASVVVAMCHGVAAGKCRECES